MKLHELKPNQGSAKARKRVGRGNASGHGTFSCRGCKGQNARTGGGVRPGFEGGQTPLIMRMPKLKGFKSPNRVSYQVVNLSKLGELKDGTEVSLELLLEKGLVSKKNVPVKILGTGDFSKKLKFTTGVFSATAREKILKAGGTIS